MTQKQKLFQNNTLLRRITLILFLPVFFFMLLIDSIFKGIKCFFEHQVYAWCGLFYEPYMEFTYYVHKYTRKNTWNW